jgi:hypothetical protein
VTGWVSLNVDVGNWSVWIPSFRSRLSRIGRSLWSAVMSTLKLASLTVSALPLPAIVAVPVMASVRPTASLSAERLASRSRTR